ncbi:MAG: hypothetical protein AMJ69_05430 [Gammaproteobacteria bacterium SG8_47]|nr:MAG: hypothetical protein AMJ69_05430 [Gammaproteobacteria bacterium SG8_47]
MEHVNTHPAWRNAAPARAQGLRLAILWVDQQLNARDHVTIVQTLQTEAGVVVARASRARVPMFLVRYRTAATQPERLRVRLREQGYRAALLSA